MEWKQQPLLTLPWSLAGRWWVINVESRACAGSRQLPLKLVIHADRLRQSNTKKSTATVRATCNRSGGKSDNLQLGLALWSWLVSDGCAAAAAASAVAIVAAFVLMIVPLGVSSSCPLPELPTVCSFTAALLLLLLHGGGKRDDFSGIGFATIAGLSVQHFACSRQTKTTFNFMGICHSRTHTLRHTPAPDKTDTLCVCQCFFFCCLLFQLFLCVLLAILSSLVLLPRRSESLFSNGSFPCCSSNNYGNNNNNIDDGN